MPDKLKSALIKFAKTFLPLLFGLFIFWLIFRKMDFREIMSILRQDVNFWFIALSLPFGLIANIIRAYRWDLLIRPLGFTPRKSNLVYAVLGNYGVNLVFPRLGEVWRCTMITRYEKIPFTKLFGTLITDRLADTVMVGLIVVAAFIMNVPYFDSFFAQHPEAFDTFNKIMTSAWMYTTIVIIGLLIWGFYKLFKNHPWVKKTKHMLASVWEGIRSIVNMKERRLFIFYTILIWLGYFLYFYICFYAFPFTKNLGWNCGLIAFGMSSVAVAVPVQGSIGPWHAMVIAVLMGFGVSSIDAGAFAFCVHTVQQLIFTASFGLFGVLALPIANKGK
ncbi:MAG: flippase-like domain-containing protein [Bacteroidales bacterium]|nr:flippase-like domain-containing protein [Bacteroidales bacterium]